MKNQKRSAYRNTLGKKLLCVTISVLMFVTMFAGNWYLENGDISINAGGTEQTVTQGSNSPVADASPVISSNGATDNSVTISSSGGATAQVTIQDAVINTSGTESAVTVTAGSSAEITIQNVDISTDGNANAIDVADNSSATIIVDGTSNNIDDSNRASGYGDSAVIHVGDGASLTIQGDGSGQNELEITGQHTHGAGIGSNNGEDFTGEINFTDDVYVHSDILENSAAVGSGYKGDFDGTINVNNGAELYAELGRNGAAIGSGYHGDVTENAQINITDATVKADTYNNGAAIGSGREGDFAGTIIIDNSEVTAIAGYINTEQDAPKGEGAAIGAGFQGNFSGEVSITDSTLIAAAFNDGAVIGTGGKDQNAPNPTEFTKDGVVNIHNSDVTLETHDQGTPIGAAEDNGIFNGTVNITGNSNVTLIDGQNEKLGDQALIGGNGGGNGSIFIEDTAQVNYWTGTIDWDNEVNYPDVPGNENYKFDQSYSTATKNGTITKADEAALKELVKNATLTISVVPKPTPNAPTTNEGSTTVCVSTAYDFWRALESRIRSSQQGDEITVNVADFTKMPCFILEALAECGVDLIIEWNGGEDIEIKHDHGIEYEYEEIEFTVLIELLKK